MHGVNATAVTVLYKSIEKLMQIFHLFKRHLCNEWS